MSIYLSLFPAFPAYLVHIIQLTGSLVIRGCAGGYSLSCCICSLLVLCMACLASTITNRWTLACFVLCGVTLALVKFEGVVTGAITVVRVLLETISYARTLRHVEKFDLDTLDFRFFSNESLCNGNIMSCWSPEIKGIQLT